jgi:ABC-2 type transport system permease protein
VLANVLPFQWMVAFPVELVLGRESPRDTLIGFAMLLGWLAVGVVVLRVTWRRGVRQYSAVGA